MGKQLEDSVAGVGIGTGELVFGGKKEDWLTRKLWQDPESASGQGLGVFRLCVSVPILSKDPAPSSSQLVGQRHFVTFYLECYWLPFCCRAGATQ